MSTADQLLIGVELTLTGMFTVFMLLAFMVLMVGWMSRLAHHLLPPAKSHPLSDHLDPTLVSAITAAIHQYRRNRR